jgi:hypothetical protein
MMMRKISILLFVLGAFLPFSFASAFSVLSTNKYAWSNNVGYINFEHVTVSDTALSGYGWSANKGFINFAPVQAGVLNDGTGNLSGEAWGEGLGYIDFSNVSINGATGKFSGTATGTLVGTITFDCPNFCDVVTDWRSSVTPAATPPTPTPVADRSRVVGGGGGGPVGNGTPLLLPNAGETLVTQPFPGAGIPFSQGTPRPTLAAVPPAAVSPLAFPTTGGKTEIAPISNLSEKPAAETPVFFLNNFFPYIIIVLLLLLLLFLLERRRHRRRLE